MQYMTVEILKRQVQKKYCF